MIHKTNISTQIYAIIEIFLEVEKNSNNLTLQITYNLTNINIFAFASSFPFFFVLSYLNSTFA